VSPRPYQVGRRRQLATEAMRSRIIAAARELLAGPSSSVFSVDAVAERADVARMTVYYQFKSKAKLLEALFDDFAARADMKGLRKAFQDPSPARGLAILIGVFCHLWATERPLLRRLNALAALDPEIDHAMTERGSWRREAITEMLQRFGRQDLTAELVDVLHVLTSFETYDALATGHRKPQDVAALLGRTAAAMLTEVREP